MSETTGAPGHRVVAVLAAFRPDKNIARNIDAVLPQVHDVIVVDDGSNADWDELLSPLSSERLERVHVLHLRENRGIAAALNHGISEALRQRADSVLTLDQDSYIDAGYVDRARLASARLSKHGQPFAAIAAGMQSGHVVRPVVHRDRGNRLTPTMEAIQSGLLIPRVVIERLGKFDESLFIDCVDTDFVMRAARAGLPTYLDRECRIEHPLGRTIEIRSVRVTRSGRNSIAFHPPWRRYYISRNRAIVLARHGIHRPRWAVLSVAGETVQLFRSLAFGPERGLQTAAVVLGVVDALRGRRGRLSGRAGLVLGAP